MTRFFAWTLLFIVVVIIAYNASPSKYYFTRTYESSVQSIYSFFKVMILIVFLLSSGYLACMLLYLIHTYQSTLFPIQVATNNRWHSESVPSDHGEGISELQNVFMDQVQEEVPEFAIDPNLRRLRRPRMGFTLLNDRSAEAANHTENIIRDKINEALLVASIAQEEQEFTTPPPSPRFVITRRHSGTQTDVNWNTAGEKSAKLAKSDFSMNSTKNAKVLRQHVAGFSNLTLHQFPRGLTKPCLSCDGMFLETYIRLVGISCEVSLDCLDTTGPWLTWGGANNKICGEKDCRKFVKDNFKEFTKVYDNKRDTQIHEILDHLTLALKYWRWMVEDGEEFKLNQPGWEKICEHFDKMSAAVKDQLSCSTFGSMSYEDVTSEIKHDFEALSLILGKNKFMLGKTPTEIDCEAFSVLSQFMWGHASCCSGVLQDIFAKFVSLSKYCQKIRKTLWSDWREQLGKIRRQPNSIMLSLDQDTESEFHEHSSSIGIPSQIKLSVDCDVCDAMTHFQDNSSLIPIQNQRKLEYGSTVQLSIDCDAETHFEDKVSSISTKTTHFRDNYYKLAPSIKDCSSSIKSEISGPKECEENVIFCMRCKTSQQQCETIRIIQDAEYFDDDFTDMQKLSYSSHKNSASIKTNNNTQ